MRPTLPSHLRMATRTLHTVLKMKPMIERNWLDWGGLPLKVLSHGSMKGSDPV